MYVIRIVHVLLLKYLVRVIAGLFAVCVQLMNISVIDTHISLLFYCHNLAL